MLHEFEAAMLYALAREHWTGQGAILDLGPFTGLSSHALASGVVDGGRRGHAAPIYSYDLWCLSGYEWFLDTAAATATGSVLPDWLALNRSHVDLIVPCPGDLLSLDWQGGQVEIAFVDLAKSWGLNHWVVSKVFPRLIPGSIVVQQDWAHFVEYWLPITMGRFADRFELVETVYGSSTLFVCTAPISEAEAQQDLSALPLREKLRHFGRAMEASTPSVRPVMVTARAKCLLDHGEVGEARRVLESVNTSVISDDPALNFAAIAADNKQMVAGLIDAARPARRWGWPLKRLRGAAAASA